MIEDGLYKLRDKMTKKLVVTYVYKGFTTSLERPKHIHYEASSISDYDIINKLTETPYNDGY